jgi:hypothetical protein
MQRAHLSDIRWHDPESRESYHLMERSSVVDLGAFAVLVQLACNVARGTASAAEKATGGKFSMERELKLFTASLSANVS